MGSAHELDGLRDVVVTEAHMIPVQQIDGLDKGCSIYVHEHMIGVADDIVTDFRHVTVPNHREAVEIAFSAGHDSKACAALAGREIPGPSQVPLGVCQQLSGLAGGGVVRVGTCGLNPKAPVRQKNNFKT